ncbi:MAG: replication protein [Bacteroidia bacterium]|nr:replication protein [Bacteroidia bacterium]
MSKGKTTAIPNEVLDAYLATLKPIELKVLLVILRSTWGWGKSCDWISMSQFVRRTGASEKAIRQALGSLCQAGTLKRTYQHGKVFYCYGKRELPTRNPSRELFSGQAGKMFRQEGKKLPPTKYTLTKTPVTRENSSKEEHDKAGLARKRVGAYLREYVFNN